MWQDCQSFHTCPLHQRTLPLHVAWTEGHSLHSPMMTFSWGGFTVFGGLFAYPHAESHLLNFSRTGILHCFSSCREMEKSWPSLRIFVCKGHSCLGLCDCVFHTNFGGRCMFPYQFVAIYVAYCGQCVCSFLGAG